MLFQNMKRTETEAEYHILCSFNLKQLSACPVALFAGLHHEIQQVLGAQNHCDKKNLHAAQYKDSQACSCPALD